MRSPSKKNEEACSVSKKRSFQVCKKIYDGIISSMNNATEAGGQLNNSLFTGHWGKLLYLFYYERFCDPSQTNAVNYLESLYEKMDVASKNFSFCTGLSGPFWLLHHLHKNNFADIDINEILSDFIDQAIEYSRLYLMDQNFDFLHGSSGICNLLTEFADRENVKLHLSFFVDKLERASLETEAGLSFPLYHYHTDPPSAIGIDAFSLAHGTCSYQIILLKISQLGIEEERCKKMIQESMRFVLHHETKNIKKEEALFPAFLDGSKITSRVSWCYGDLGVATALWRCGKHFNNSEWCEKAIAIYEHNADRNTCETAGVMDTCLCHGTAGNAAMYLRMWKESGAPRLKKCADEWLRLSYKMLEFSSDGLSLKMWNGTEGWDYKWNLLNGSVGVGLTLISDYAFSALPWDDLLLIS